MIVQNFVKKTLRTETFCVKSPKVAKASTTTLTVMWTFTHGFSEHFAKVNAV